MPDLHLSAVTRTSGANAALKDGTVRPAGVTLDFVEVPVLVQGFRRMVRSLEFDVSEMALTTYLVAKAHGVRFTALPVFLVRGFHHGAVQVDPRAGLRDPRELEGRRVGVNRGYTVTTGVWARGILAEEHGVDLDRVTWVLSGDEHVAEYRPPANVVPMLAGGDLTQLLLDGDLSAAIGVDGDAVGLTSLIPDPEEAGLAAMRRDGVFPINHLVVVRDDVLAAHPEVAAELFTAFAEAKHQYVDTLAGDPGTAANATDRTYQRVREVTGADPLPYGIEPNRAALEKLLDHAVAQRILDRRPTLESLFAAGTSELTA
jgi:4,5-dihydroxyphthalate decarboxylase